MSRRIYLACLLILVCIGAKLRYANFGNVTSRTPDERVYTWQAKTWLESGSKGLRDMVSEYKADPETRYYPPPTRVGMIRLVADVLKATGRSDEAAGAWISFVGSLGSLLAVAVIGYRFLPPWATLASLLFYSVLPPELAISRRTWTDALVECAGLLLIWFVAEIANGSKRREWCLAMAVVGSLAVLVKESMPVPYTLGGLWILWTLLKRRDRQGALLFLAATGAGMGLAVWWLAAQLGSLNDYISIVLGIPAANAANPYAIEYASGPGYMMLLAFWIVAPITSLFAVAGLISAVRNAAPMRWIACFTIAYLAIAMSMPHWLNLRYAGNTFGPVCLLAGLGAFAVIARVMAWLEVSDRRVFAVIAVAIVIGGATADYLRFRRYFVRDEIADLSMKMLLDERGQ